MLKNIAKQPVLYVGIALAGLSASCDDKMPDNSPRAPLELSRTSILVGKNATTAHIGVTARNSPWTLAGDEDWCRATPAAGETGISNITITFLDNEGDESREVTFVLVSGEIRKEISVQQLSTEIVLPNQNEEFYVNKEIYDKLQEWYYWNDEVASTAADYNQSYKTFFENYLKYLKKNTPDGNIWSKTTQRYLYSYINRNPRGTAASGIAPLNYGMEFDLGDYDGKLVGRILYVMDNSPAAKAGLKRGDWFYKVNDVQMGAWENIEWGYQYNRLIDTLVRPRQGESPELGMLTFISYAGQLRDDKKTITVGSDNFRGSPILHSSVIGATDRDGDAVKAGYMVYNSFDPQYRNELIAEFGNTFRNKDLTHFILDLRYNRSGTVEMAKLMAELMLPPDFNGQTFVQYEFNAGLGSLDRTIPLFAQANSAAVKTIFILTSKMTAGASELLINSLRGLDGVTLVVIGDTTEGMSMGMVKCTYATDDYEYDAYPLAFKCYNAKGEGNYEYGLSPNGATINEWVGDYVKWRDRFGWNELTGGTQDALLEKAMGYVTKASVMPSNPVLNSSSSRRQGYPRVFSVQASMTMDIE